MCRTLCRGRLGLRWMVSWVPRAACQPVHGWASHPWHPIVPLSFCGSIVAVAIILSTPLLFAQRVVESPRKIPIVCDVDVVVVGGSSGAVEAACHAATSGAQVFLLASTPYLGTDLCSTLRLWLEKGEEPTSPLAVACFGTQRRATPFAVKAAMDQALLNAGVRYLTGCFVTDVLTDKDGQVAGIVMANRSGRQAIRAKVVVDATHQAAAARLARVPFRPFAPGSQTFARVVIGGESRTGKGVLIDKKPFTCDLVTKKTEYHLPVYEYTLQIGMKDNGVVSFFDVENRARDMTYAPESEVASEVLYRLPSDTIIGEEHSEAWPGASTASLRAFRPRGFTRLYVLSAYADLGTQAQQHLLRPLQFMETGARIGQAAAEEARGVPTLGHASLAETSETADDCGDLEEHLSGIRPTNLGTIHSGRRALPVLGRYDVVVVGGGTSGAPAGIAAAKNGAKTLVLEYLHELGGVGTTGLIGSYWYGIRNGYTGYVDKHVNPGQETWSVPAKAEWLRQELRRNGADVWFGAFGCGAIVRDRQVRGVIVATPQGRGVVLASTVVDATGNADLAACAHAPTSYSISERGSLNVQIAGFPERPLKKSIVNTCYTMVDDTDVLDVWHLMVWRRTGSLKTSYFDVGQLVDSRERRRIVGDYTLTVEDILSRRTFPDTISHHYSNFDAAAFPDARVLLMSDAKGPCFHTDMPYRCLLPKGIDGILVVGLGASAERDAMTLVRMQADLQNQGYAAGLAAATAARAGGHTRAVDIGALQKQLIREEVLEARVATDNDSHPAGIQQIKHAVETIVAADQPARLAAMAVVSAHGQQSIPLLGEHYRNASADNRKIEYAKVLGILGDATGVPSLIAAIDAHDGWDQGVPLTSQRKTGNTFSDLDRLVIAAGYSGAPEASACLLRKLAQLSLDSPLSHYKAISMAVWNSRPPEAAKPLADLLSQPGFRGHATVEPVIRQQNSSGGWIATAADRLITASADAASNSTNLNRAMKELLVAALLYRCGDRDGMGKAVLQQYAQDIHGHLASYAQAVLGNDTPALRHSTDEPSQGRTGLFETTTVWPAYPRNRPNYRIPAILLAPNGDLLIFAEKRNDGPGDLGDHDLVMKRSRDQGKTWSLEVVIFDDGPNDSTDPTLLLDSQRGVIWLFFLRDKARYYCLSSADSGHTWTGPRSIHAAVTRPEWDQLSCSDRGAKPAQSRYQGLFWNADWVQRYGVGPGWGAIQIQHGPKAGRLLVPARHLEGPQGGPYRSFSHVFFSDDHGETWHVGSNAVPDWQRVPARRTGRRPGDDPGARRRQSPPARQVSPPDGHQL